MPFIATCTYCRASKFRVPYKKRGSFATCPKCEREFLLAPESGVDVPLMNYKELPFEDEEEILDGEGSSELVETLPDHEPVSEEPPPTATPSIDKVDVVVAAPRRAPTDLPLRFALAGVALFGLAMLATLFPYGRLIAAPIAFLGLALAAMGWLGLEKFAWLGAAGTALNGLLLAAVLVVPSWLGLGNWLPEADPESAPKQALAISKESGVRRPADWVDAATAVWQYGDVRIAIAGVKVGPLDRAAKTAEKRKDRVLRIALTLENVGVARPIQLLPWHEPPSREVKLLAAGVSVPLRPAPVEPTMIYPSRSGESLLQFDAPDKLDDLRLELSGSAFGDSEPIRFLIPKAMIVGLR